MSAVFATLAERAAEELTAAGHELARVPLGDTATCLCWEERWAGEVGRSVGVTAVFSAGLNPSRSAHLQLVAVLEMACPGLANRAGWVGFAQHLAFRFQPARLIIDPETQRLAWTWQEVLMDGTAPRLLERIGHLSGLAHRAMPLLANLIEAFPGADDEADEAQLGREAAEAVFREAASLGTLT
jgi:hypothetical protein